MQIKPTERLLVQFLNTPDGHANSVQRIDSLINGAEEAKSLLNDYLLKLQQEDLPEDD